MERSTHSITRSALSLLFSFGAPPALPANVLAQEDGSTERPAQAHYYGLFEGGAEDDQLLGRFPDLDRSGRFLVYLRSIPRLDAAGVNAGPLQEVVVHDRVLGSSQVVVRCAVEAGTINALQISSDGEHVFFSTSVSGLIPEDNNQRWDAYVFHRTTDTLSLVSSSVKGVSGSGDSWLGSSAAISADGRYVVLTSTASDFLASDTDTNSAADVYIKDMQTGLIHRVNTVLGGKESSGPAGGAAISPNAKYVAYWSRAADLIAVDTNESPDVFLFDRERKTTVRAHMGRLGKQVTGSPQYIAVSDAGLVAFSTDAPNLVSDDPAGRDVFLVDPLKKTVRLIAPKGAEGEQGEMCTYPIFSDDGRFLCFQTIMRDQQGARSRQVWVHDTVTTSSTRVGIMPNVTSAAWSDVAFSGNGELVALPQAQSLPQIVSFTALNLFGPSWKREWESDSAQRILSATQRKEYFLSGLLRTLRQDDASISVVGWIGRRNEHSTNRPVAPLPDILTHDVPIDQPPAPALPSESPKLTPDVQLLISLLLPDTATQDLAQHQKALRSIVEDHSRPLLERAAALHCVAEESDAAAEELLVRCMAEQELGIFAAILLAQRAHTTSEMVASRLSASTGQTPLESNLLICAGLLGDKGAGLFSNLVKLLHERTSNTSKVPPPEALYFALDRISSVPVNAQAVKDGIESPNEFLRALALRQVANEQSGDSYLAAAKDLLSSDSWTVSVVLDAITAWGEAASDIAVQLADDVVGENNEARQTAIARALAHMGHAGFDPIVDQLYPNDKLGMEGNRLVDIMAEENPQYVANWLSERGNLALKLSFLLRLSHSVTRSAPLRQALCQIMHAESEVLLQEGAAEALRSAPPGDKETLEALRRGCASTDPDIRAVSVTSLLTLHPDDAQALALADALLSEPDLIPDEQLKLTIKLYDQGVVTPRIIEFITRGAFRAHSLVLNMRALGILKELGPRASVALPALLDEMTQDLPLAAIASSALFSLEQGGGLPRDERLEELQKLRAQCKEPDSIAQWRAEAAPYLSDLLDLSSHSDQYIRYKALPLLGEMYSGQTEIVAAFKEVLLHDVPALKYRALFCLPGGCVRDAEIRTRVLEIVKNKEERPFTRLAACEAVARGEDRELLRQTLIATAPSVTEEWNAQFMQLVGKAQVPELLEWLTTCAVNQYVPNEARESALRSVAQYGKNAHERWRELFPLLDDERVCADALYTLAAIQAPANQFLPRCVSFLENKGLDHLMNDPKSGDAVSNVGTLVVSARVRSASEYAITRYGREAMPYVIKALHGEHPSQRAGAAEVIAYLNTEAYAWIDEHKERAAEVVDPLCDMLVKDFPYKSIEAHWKENEAAGPALSVLRTYSLPKVKAFLTDDRVMNLPSVPERLVRVICAIGEGSLDTVRDMLHSTDSRIQVPTKLNIACMHTAGIPLIVECALDQTLKSSDRRFIVDNFVSGYDGEQRDELLLAAFEPITKDTKRSPAERCLARIWCFRRQPDSKEFRSALIQDIINTTIPAVIRAQAIAGFESLADKKLDLQDVIGPITKIAFGPDGQILDYQELKDQAHRLLERIKVPK